MIFQWPRQPRASATSIILISIASKFSVDPNRRCSARARSAARSAIFLAILILALRVFRLNSAHQRVFH